MMRHESIPYVDLTSTIGARMVHLPFQNKDFTFTIILPNKGVKLTQVESRLTPAIFTSPTTKKSLILLYIPKWKLEFSSDMVEVLKKKMKVTELFNKQKANLKGLSSTNGSFVSNILHKYVYRP
jgi:serine protease inhibitor